MKKRKILVSLLTAAALVGISTTMLTSCKNDDPKTPEVLKYDVTFDSKGGSAVDKKTGVENGSKITKPVDPTKNDFTFGGWYKDSECTKEWKFDTDTVTSNITLYAKWTPKGEQPGDKFTVTFDSKGGSAVAAKTDIAKDSTITAPEAPTKTDFTFVGWYKDNNCTEAWNFETDKVTANITLYAKWEAVEDVPQAILVFNNGSENGTLDAVKDGGKFFYDKPADPKKDYNSFVGWFTDSECTESYNFENEAVDGITLYAKYEQAFDTVYSQFNFGEANTIIGATASSAETVVGRFTCAAGVRIDSGTILNTQGKVISFDLKGETGNGLTLEASWGSSTKVGSFYLTNTDTNTIVKQIDGLKSKDVISVNEMNLPKGHYTITSDASLKITALSLTEKLPQGPTKGIALETASVQSQYLAGRAFSSNGLAVFLEYENGRKDELASDKYTISTVDTATAGKKTVTVTYQFNSTTTYTETFEINVYEIEELVVYTHVLDGKRVTHNAQTLFALNDTFNYDNIAVKAKCLLPKANPEDAQEYIEFVLSADEFNLEAPDLTTAGNKSVQISYTNDMAKVASYEVEVMPINDLSQAELVTVFADPTAEQLGLGTWGSDQVCYCVHTINQALQFFELAKVSDDAQKQIGLKKATVYNEKVEINIPNLQMGTLLTEQEMENPKAEDFATIEFNAINGQMDPSETINYETSGSATFSVRATATNFEAWAINFKNYWNTAERYAESLKIYGNGHTQAVAVLVEADKVSFGLCNFSSYQDTLYAKNGRQSYFRCTIEGHTDFIFGDDATAAFTSCDIHTIGNGDSANGGYVVATKGKTANDKELKYGYIFDNCEFTADEATVAGTTSLGRAWASGMSMMVMNSNLGAHISKEAYKEVTSTDENKNDRYGKLNADPTASLILEYNNTGDGAITMSLENTCTVVTDAAVANEYGNLNIVFGADNGSVQYDDVWFPDSEMDATIELRDTNDAVIQIIDGASYVGSTITKSMLAERVEKIEGQTILGFYSDKACTVEYDYSTVLAETNVIYVKLQAGVVKQTESFNASTTGYTGTESLRSNPYTGASFSLVAGGAGDTKAAAVTMEAAANDDSGLTFTRAFVPTGSGRTYTITASKDVTITVYYTVSNGDIVKEITAAYTKSGELTVGGAVVTEVGPKYNNVAYAYTLTLKAGDVVELGTDATSNRLILFGVIAEYAL